MPARTPTDGNRQKKGPNRADREQPRRGHARRRDHYHFHFHWTDERATSESSCAGKKKGLIGNSFGNHPHVGRKRLTHARLVITDADFRSRSEQNAHVTSRLSVHTLDEP